MEPGAWMEVHRTAHQLGLPIDSHDDVWPCGRALGYCDPFRGLKKLQDEMGGFTAFIPMEL